MCEASRRLEPPAVRERKVLHAAAVRDGVEQLRLAASRARVLGKWDCKQLRTPAVVLYHVNVAEDILCVIT